MVTTMTEQERAEAIQAEMQALDLLSESEWEIWAEIGQEIDQ